MGVAIVGTGRIAESYGKSLSSTPEKVSIVGAYDLVPERAEQFVATHGGKQYGSYEELLADRDVEIVVNLTTHQAHADVTAPALEAGKHVHSEKPLACSRADGLRLLELAEAKGLRFSCSPFTFMGEGQQTFMKQIREGVIGDVLVAYAEANWGPNHRWNPRVIPFHQKGGGPLLDVGVYPLTFLTAALGPVARVTGFAHIVEPHRVIGSGPDEGKAFTVETPDHVVAGLEFACGTVGRLTAGFCSVKSKQTNGVEFHGRDGSLAITSGHDFNAAIERFEWESKTWSAVPALREPFAGVEWGRAVFDLVDSLQTGSPQHCTARHAYHVLDVCLSILESGEQGRRIDVNSRFEPPPPMPWA
jgi:predicted dehydrogenase